MKKQSNSKKNKSIKFLQKDFITLKNLQVVKKLKKKI